MKSRMSVSNCCCKQSSNCFKFGDSFDRPDGTPLTVYSPNSCNWVAISGSLECSEHTCVGQGIVRADKGLGLPDVGVNLKVLLPSMYATARVRLRDTTLYGESWYEWRFSRTNSRMIITTQCMYRGDLSDSFSRSKSWDFSRASEEWYTVRVDGYGSYGSMYSPFFTSSAMIMDSTQRTVAIRLDEAYQITGELVEYSGGVSIGIDGGARLDDFECVAVRAGPYNPECEWLRPANPPVLVEDFAVDADLQSRVSTYPGNGNEVESKQAQWVRGGWAVQETAVNFVDNKLVFNYDQDMDLSNSASSAYTWIDPRIMEIGDTHILQATFRGFDASPNRETTWGYSHLFYTGYAYGNYSIGPAHQYIDGAYRKVISVNPNAIPYVYDWGDGDTFKIIMTRTEFDRIVIEMFYNDLLLNTFQSVYIPNHPTDWVNYIPSGYPVVAGINFNFSPGAMVPIWAPPNNIPNRAWWGDFSFSSSSLPIQSAFRTDQNP